MYSLIIKFVLSWLYYKYMYRQLEVVVGCGLWFLFL